MSLSVNSVPLNISFRVNQNFDTPDDTTINQLIEDKSEYDDYIKDKQTLPTDTFYVRLNGYPMDLYWSLKMNEATYKISSLISNGADFDTVLKATEESVQKINCAQVYGQRRELKSHRLLVPLSSGRGAEYYDRYYKSACDKMRGPEPIEEYKDADTDVLKLAEEARVAVLYYNENGHINLEFAKQEFEKLRSIESPTEEEITRSVAIIRWLIAQGMPYKRGSDSVGNLLCNSIYHSYGIQISPLRVGKSLDYEAFDSDLADYIKRYNDFFEKDHIKIKQAR